MPTLDYGIWGYIHHTNGAIFTVGSLLLLANTLLFNPRRHRKGNVCLIIGIFIVLFWNLIYLAGFIQPWIYNLPVPFLLISLFFSLAIFRYHSLDFLPMARNLVLEKMDDPYVILSPDALVLDMNPSLAPVFNLEPGDSIGKNFKNVFSMWPEIVSIITHPDKEGKKDYIFSLETGEKKSYSRKRFVISETCSDSRHR